MKKSKKKEEEERLEKERQLIEQKENIEKLGEVIKNQKKVSGEGKDKIKKKIFENAIFAIVFAVYFYLIYLGSQNLETNVFLTVLKAFSCVFLGVAIIIFEISYKKDNDPLAVHGIEILIVSIVSLILVYFYSMYISRVFVTIIISISFVSTIYFVIKSVILWYRVKKRDLKRKKI